MKMNLASLALASLGLASPFAHAADTSFAFDDLTPNDALRAQYANQGVTFETGTIFKSATARSGENVAVGMRVGELGTPYIRGTFTAPYASSITAWIENNAAENIYISAFDANGARIKEVDDKRTAAPGTYRSLTLTSASANIATFVIGGDVGGQSIIVDDLSFEREAAQGAGTTIQIDAAKGRHAIDPRIYGITWASQSQMDDLNAPTNRHGGTPTSSYNWVENADNRGNDWYFESLGYPSATPGEFTDSFISASKAGGGEPMMTLPMLDWIAKLGDNRSDLSSYSVKKYGAQTDHDPNTPDFGSGFAQGTKAPITNNDPNDASTPNSVDYQRQWIKHNIEKWGSAANGGVRYYGLDNEPGIWHHSHQDVQPVGIKQDDYLSKALDFAGMIKEEDPNAIVTGPEEWGWDGFFYSGYDQQYGAAHNFQSFPDRAAHGGMEYSAWLLDQFHKNEMNTGKRLLDVFTLHYYPQSGEFSASGDDAITQKMQLLRNESTRSLWDPNYKDKSWINNKVNLISRMKNWVNTYYPGTQIGLTEYNWGAEDHINGATAQADVLGILGREGVDVANRWTTPETGTPTYNAMKLYRNYDGSKSTFGDTSVSATGPNPDETAVFAAERTNDGAMTVIVDNKVLDGDTPMSMSLANFSAGAQAQVWQLTKTNKIERLADVAVNAGTITTTVPAQSITLLVIPKSGVVAPVGDPAFTSTATVQPNAAPGEALNVKATFAITSGSLDNGIVDLEVYNAQGEKVDQKTWENQSFAGVDSHDYEATLTAPLAEGVYTVKLGVFNSDWTKNPHWNDAAATFTVTKPVAPVGDPTFTSSATVTPETVEPGKDLTIAATVAGVEGELNDAIVDVEVYNAAGERISQNTWMGQSFTAGQSENYSFTLTAPAAEGTYTVNIGVFNADWTKNPHWNNQAATFTVKTEGVEPVQQGDLNGDGQVKLQDVILMLRIAVGIDPATPGQTLIGDLDGNGSISIGDAIALLRKVIGL